MATTVLYTSLLCAQTIETAEPGFSDSANAGDYRHYLDKKTFVAPVPL